MKVTILNGNPDGRNRIFEQFLSKLTVFLEKDKHEAILLKLRSMDIKSCIGCWSCWVKTPGKCLVKDDSDQICREMMSSDLVLLCSPLVMGFVSMELKKAMDKMIPLLHPYVILVNGETHHKKRYDKYPALGLILKKDDDCDDEDIEITTNIFNRFALNFHSSVKFVGYSNNPLEEVMNEINNL